jgi:hypothetical protein
MAKGFGYSSIAGIVTVPRGGTSSCGGWNEHFGGDRQAVGDIPNAFTGGDGSPFVGAVGGGLAH